MSDETYEHLDPLLERYAAASPGDPLREQLRDRLVAGFLPVAQHIARRFTRRGEPLEDLEQVASIGLMHALQRYDPDRGRSFLSYAIPTITGEVRRHFRDTTWSVHTPRGIKDRYLAVGSATTTLSQDLGRAPTPTELAAHLGLAVHEVTEAVAAHGAHHSASLDELTGDQDHAPGLADVLGAQDPDFARAETRMLIGQLLHVLPERERTILRLRFVHEKTQSEIGTALCISQMHVSRLLARSLDQLRAELHRHEDEDVPAEAAPTPAVA